MKTSVKNDILISDNDKLNLKIPLGSIAYINSAKNNNTANFVKNLIKYQSVKTFNTLFSPSVVSKEESVLGSLSEGLSFSYILDSCLCNNEASYSSILEHFQILDSLSELLISYGAPYCEKCKSQAIRFDDDSLRKKLKSYNSGVLSLTFKIENSTELSLGSFLDMFDLEYYILDEVLKKRSELDPVLNISIDEINSKHNLSCVVSTYNLPISAKSLSRLFIDIEKFFQLGFKELLLLPLVNKKPQYEDSLECYHAYKCQCGTYFDRLNSEFLKLALKNYLLLGDINQPFKNIENIKVNEYSIDMLLEINLKKLQVVIGDIDRSISDRFRELTSSLDSFGFSNLSLKNIFNPTSSSMRIRLVFAWLQKSALSDCLFVFDNIFSYFTDNEARRYLVELESLKNSSNTLLILDNKVFEGLESLVKDSGSESLDYKTLQKPKLNNKVKKLLEFSIPSQSLVCLRGASGTGKEDLLEKIGALKKEFDSTQLINLDSLKVVKNKNLIESIDIYKKIIHIFLQTPSARRSGFEEIDFSISRSSYACKKCKALGRSKLEEDIFASFDSFMQQDQVCESCMGLRFSSDILNVKYKELNISDLLQMSVKHAASFFWEHEEISNKLFKLKDFGFGHLGLGCTQSELSKTELIRLKLFNMVLKASKRSLKKSLFLLESPFYGLSNDEFYSIVDILYNLINDGCTIICIDNSKRFYDVSTYQVELGIYKGAMAIVSQGHIDDKK